LEIRRALAALGLVALIIPATVSAASPNNWTATANIEYGNAACGNHIPGAPIVGTVEFTRTGGQMALRVQVGGEGADADTDYILTLWNASNCSQIGGEIATITTDGSGLADESFTGIRLKGAKSVFATLWNVDLGFYNDTTIVP
jgi:hypothetical protein